MEVPWGCHKGGRFVNANRQTAAAPGKVVWAAAAAVDPAELGIVYAHLLLAVRRVRTDLVLKSQS